MSPGVEAAQAKAGGSAPDPATDKKAKRKARCYPWNPPFHRRGLLKADDSPYPLLIEATRRCNEAVLRLVCGRP